MNASLTKRLAKLAEFQATQLAAREKQAFSVAFRTLSNDDLALSNAFVSRISPDNYLGVVKRREGLHQVE